MNGCFCKMSKESWDASRKLEKTVAKIHQIKQVI